MANEQNLRPFPTRTESEKKAIQHAGGVASGEARRRRRKMREQAELLLGLTVKSEVGKRQLTELLGTYDPDSDDNDNQKAILAAMVNKALLGDQDAAQFLRDIVGEKPDSTVNLAGGLAFGFANLPPDTTQDDIMG